MMRQAISCYETPVESYQTTWHRITEEGSLQLNETDAFSVLCGPSHFNQVFQGVLVLHFGRIRKELTIRNHSFLSVSL